MALFKKRPAMPSGKRPVIMDIGFGHKSDFYKRARKSPGIDHLGVDPSPQPLFWIGKKPGNAWVIRSHFEKLQGVPEGFADMIRAEESIGYRGDTAAQTKQAFRFLKPGGMMFVSGHGDMAKRLKEELRNAGFTDVSDRQLGPDEPASPWMESFRSFGRPILKVRGRKPK